MRRLAADAATTFVLTPQGRIAAENEPAPSAGPRLFLASGAEGRLLLMRHDVDEATARDVRRVVDAAPAWTDPEVPPPHLGALMELMSRQAPVTAATRAVIHDLPRGLAFASEARFIASETPDGERLLVRLADSGPPQALAQAGFTGIDDFWAPWCVALDGDEIAAIAFAARLSAHGAAIGVYTFAPFRGRGFAAAVTAEWSRLPQLAGRDLTYSALVDNVSSRRVIDRLALPRLGASLRIV